MEQAKETQDGVALVTSGARGKSNTEPKYPPEEQDLRSSSKLGHPYHFGRAFIVPYDKVTT